MTILRGPEKSAVGRGGSRVSVMIGVSDLIRVGIRELEFVGSID